MTVEEIAALEYALEYVDAITCDNESCRDCDEKRAHEKALRALIERERATAGKEPTDAK